MLLHGTWHKSVSRSKEGRPGQRSGVNCGRSAHTMALGPQQIPVPVPVPLSPSALGLLGHAPLQSQLRPRLPALGHPLCIRVRCCPFAYQALYAEALHCQSSGIYARTCPCVLVAPLQISAEGEIQKGWLCASRPHAFSSSTHAGVRRWITCLPH